MMNVMKMNIDYLNGIGSARAKKLQKIDIHSVEDLLLSVPKCYLDRRLITQISCISAGSEVNVKGKVISTEFRPSRSGKRMFRAVLDDGSSIVELVFFHSKYIRSKVYRGVTLIASGSVHYWGSGLTMTHPDLTFPDGDGVFRSSPVIPVYTLTAGITQGVMRKIRQSALDATSGKITEIFTSEVLKKYGWNSREEIIRTVHFPENPEQGERARRMLALEELYLYQLLLLRIREKAKLFKGINLSGGIGRLDVFVSSLPWKLTKAQVRAINLLKDDISGKSPMRRLLQGDVGSGKTVVAAAGCVIAAHAGFQSAIAAPTEVLAVQHSITFEKLLKPLDIRCELITGGTGTVKRREIKEKLENGEVDVIIGTHALFEEDIIIPNLAYVAIDEQHKFGVEQREKLVTGKLQRPHMLVMSATPIPRTLAMTLYGDLDISVLDELPPGRGIIKTQIMGADMKKQVYEALYQRLKAGERAYIVYPLRESSENQDLRDASSSFEIIRNSNLGEFGVGLLTGDMKSSEKLSVSARFASGEISVLVCTTVVEVGLDVPEATVMIIAHAGRFGLSQLHQMRGRIGRSSRNSWCFLMADDELSEEAKERLDVLSTTLDGFKVAEKDLEMRGPGEVAGTRQHGTPVFRVASLVSDTALLVEARSITREYDMNKGLPEECRSRFEMIDAPGV